MTATAFTPTVTPDPGYAPFPEAGLTELARYFEAEHDERIFGAQHIRDTDHAALVCREAVLNFDALRTRCLESELALLLAPRAVPSELVNALRSAIESAKGRRFVVATLDLPIAEALLTALGGEG